MKTCPLCQESHDTKRSYCPTCCNAKSREWYQKNLEAKRAQAREHYQRNKSARLSAVRARTESKREFIRVAKDAPCADCGLRYPPHVMDLDHVGDKLFGLATAVRLHKSEDEIRAEMAKCEVVCANCHRVRTFSRRRV